MLCLQIFISMNSVLKPFVPLGDMASSRYSFGHHSTSEHQTSIVDDLLFEIYDRWYDNRHDSFESDTFTECSSTSEVGHWRRNSVFREIDNKHSQWLHQGILETQSIQQLRKMIPELQHRVNYTSSRLVRQLKRRDRRWAKLQHNCDLVTAILQASSQKRRVDTRIRFSLEPPPGDSAFEQWKDAMKAVSRLPLGIPDSFRRKVWLSLADNHIKELRIDWNKTIRFAFNERSNPDDNTLGMQIVKDLHRTGCSGFSGHDNDEDRAILKRVLLGYARWNKTVGYCQGFNVIAALLLEVMDRKEDDALKVMIYLIDHVLPESYYANNLRSLSVDMAVFRDLLGLMFPKLSKHLDYLQHAAQDKTTGASYEPPLTNVFTMQWFLTMFATCLPKDLVLRVWDSILLEGSEILLRTALAIWGKLAKRIMSVSSADEFYSLMGTLTQEMMDGKIFHADSLVKFIYACAPFPMPQLPELREKYTYNIRPFSGTPSGSKKSSLMGGMLPSDEDDLDEEDLEAITCFTGIIPSQIGGGKSKGQDGDGISGSADISMVGPGAYGMGTDSSASANTSVVMERMCTDISSLKKQYHRLKQRQTQAHIIIAAASAKQRTKVKAIVPKIETPKAMNHLFIGKQASAPNVNAKNRFVTASPRIAPVFPKVTMIPRFLQNGSKKPSPSKMRKEQSLTESRVIAEENKSEEETDKEEEQELSAPVQSEIDSNEINDISKTEENNKKEDDTNEIEGEENEDDIEKKENDEKYVSEIDHCKENQSKVKCEGCDESESHHSGVVEMETEKNTGLLSSMLEDMSLSNEIIEALNQLNSDDVERTESDVINDDKVSSTETGEMVKSSSDNVGPTEEERNSNVDNDNVSVTTSEALENVAVSADNIDSTDNIDSIDKTDECVSIREEVEKFLLDTCQENVDDKSDIYLHDQCPEIQEEISLGSFNSHDCHEEFIHKLPEDFHGRSLEEEVLDIANRISSNNAQNLLHDVFGVASEECSSLPEIDATIDDYNISESGENCDQGCEISTNDKSLSEDESKILKSSDECVHSVSESTDLRQNSSFPHHKENSDSNLNTNENSNPSITNYAKDNIDYSSHAKGLRIKSIDLAKYKESKKSVSRSCSQESESSKYFTDSDTSVFSPDSDKSISWTSDVKSFNNFKHAVSKKPFNPFPVTHFNENRAKTGIKLGLYKSSMFMQMEKQPKRKPLWSK